VKTFFLLFPLGFYVISISADGADPVV